jgi:predicted phage terminase large subunit-like protein
VVDDAIARASVAHHGAAGVSTGIEDPPNTVHLRVPLHDQGPALWPSYIGLDKLEEALQDVGTPIFETMYQGRRGGLAGQIIVEEFFRYFHGKPPGTTYMTVDPAISKKTEADETAIVVGNVELEAVLDRRRAQQWIQGETPDPIIRGSIYLRWAWHGKVGLKETESIIVEAYDYYRPVAIGIEAVAYQSALVQLMEADHPELPIEPVTPEKDKLSRFLALGRLYEFGRVYHHPDWRASAAEYQLTHLPNGRHDDIPDAIAHLAKMAGISAPIIAVERPPGAL